MIHRCYLVTIYGDIFMTDFSQSLNAANNFDKKDNKQESGPCRTCFCGSNWELF